MSVSIVLEQMIVVFIMVMVGFLLFRLGILSKSASREISALVVNVCCPALILMSIYENETEIPVENLLLTAFVGVILYALLVIFGMVMPKLLGAKRIDEKLAYNMMTIFGNIGFMGIPVASAVLGAEGVVYLVVCNIVFNLLIYSYGVYVISKGINGKDMKFQPRKLINVGTIAAVIAIILCFVDVSVPSILSSAISYMGRATTFLSMVVIGINLAQISFKDLISEKRIFAFVGIRQILIPVVAAFVLRIFIKDEMLLATLVLMLALPVANMPLMMVEEAGQDGRVLSLGIIITTVLAVVTVPLVVMFL